MIIGVGTGMNAISTNSTASGASQDFFGLAAQRLGYIDQRQKLLAQNIANADTPDYHPRDLSPFAAYLEATPVAPARTDPNHLSGTVANAAFVVQKGPDRSIDGNTVDVEQQLTNVADDENAAALVGNLWKTTMGMYLTALGRAG